VRLREEEDDERMIPLGMDDEMFEKLQEKIEKEGELSLKKARER
jgi:hypothetical protein